jgi:hypothetical protein
VALVVRPDQLRGHPYTVAVTPDAAFDDERGVQVLADLTHAPARALVFEGRRPRDDTESSRVEPRQLGNDLFGEAVADVVLRGIVAQVVERQHDEHLPCRRHVARAQRSPAGESQNQQDGGGDRQAPGKAARPRRRRRLGRCRGPFDRSHEAVTQSGKRFDVARLLGGVAKCLSQPGDGGVQVVVEVDERVLAPEALAQIVAAHQFAGTFQQRDEEFERKSRQADPPSVPGQLPRARVRLERPEADRRVHQVPGGAVMVLRRCDQRTAVTGTLCAFTCI